MALEIDLQSESSIPESCEIIVDTSKLINMYQKPQKSHLDLHAGCQGFLESWVLCSCLLGCSGW